MSKGLDALERFKQPQMMSDIDWHSRIDIIEKELKALEIIKKYHITSAFFMFNSTYKTYEINMSFYEDEELMTEEEYNLAKEILK